jgi:large subunit ribosomal protein L10
MAVTRADKEAELQLLEGMFHGADAAILIDYKGINVPQVTELRRELKKASASYKVVKNTLAKRALKGTPFESLSGHFEGTTAIAYTGSDPVGLAKTLTTFMKGAPMLQIKAAVVQGQAIKAAQVTELANMPGKPELYAKLLFLMQAPATNLVRVLSAVPRDLVNVLANAEKARA